MKKTIDIFKMVVIAVGLILAFSAVGSILGGG